MLTNLNIKNYKSIKEANLPLSPLTIFSGLNGMGKSSVIQVLLLLRQSFKGKFFGDGLFLKDEDGIMLGFGKDVFFSGAEQNEDLAFELEWDFEKEMQLVFEYHESKDVLPLKDFNYHLDHNLQTQALFTNKFQYLSANRINPQTQYKTSTYNVEELKWLGKTGEYTVHYLATNQDKPVRNKALIHPNAKSDNLLNNVSAWLSEISPGIKVNATYHPDLDTASLSYQFEQTYDYSENYKPVHVGFGITYVLPVITALLMADKDALVIIENPESHLHPAGQAQVGRLCALAAESGVHVVIETHSDHLINGVCVGVKKKIIEASNVSLFFFAQQVGDLGRETEITPLFIDDRGKIDEWPAGFMDEWEKQLDELIER